MLVLSRKKGEEIEIGSGIRVVVVAVLGDKVRLGVIAPREVPVDRGEIAEAKRLSEKTDETTDEKTGRAAA